MSSKEQEADRNTIASIVIPAHDEAAVIGRLLQSLPAKVDGRDLQIIVACNGCTDNTADIARQHGAIVVEVDTPSKIAALNAADEVATAFPRLYVDADIVLTNKIVRDLIQALSAPGLLCAAPPYRMELAGRSWALRAYFTVSAKVMQLKDGYVGSGVYALSKEGRERFGRFPNVIADDTFVRNSFSRTERRVIATDPSVVQAPWTLRALVRRRIRVSVGNFQLSAHPDYRPVPGGGETSVSWWRVVMANPTLIPGSVIYATVNLIGRLLASRQIRSKGPIDWGRDNTTRSVVS